jgi:hypothetical protein
MSQSAISNLPKGLPSGAYFPDRAEVAWTVNHFEAVKIGFSDGVKEKRIKIFSEYKK